MPKLNKLFVYGIFLDAEMRKSYGMSNSHYATVRDYVTVAKYSDGHIVEAAHFPRLNVVLTGLIVDVQPFDLDGRSTWEYLDRLENGYDRVKIVTTDDERAYMYVQRSSNEQA